MPFGYVDSSVWITYMEGKPAYQRVVDSELTLLERKGWQLCLSDLVILEVLIKPQNENRVQLVDSYKGVFSKGVLLPTFQAVFERSHSLAQENGLKALDAIHVAFAIEYGCELFITTDPDFRFLKSLPVRWIDLSRESP